MISLFVDDPRFIGIFATIIAIFGLTTLLIVFRNKIPIVKKYYTQNRINTLLFGIGCVLGLVITGLYGWQIFDEEASKELWMKNILYFLSGTNGFILTIMFFWFACMLPIRYFSNICLFGSFKEPFKKFIKLTLFYTLFASIAIAISTMQYGLAEPFFSYDSTFRFTNQNTDFSKLPTYYLAGQYILIFVLREKWYTVIFISAILLICIVEFIVIRYMQKHKSATLLVVVKKLDKIGEWSKFINYTTPVLLFVAMTLSLSVHAIAATLHLSLLFMMIIILTIVIFALNAIYTWIIGTSNKNEYKKLIKVSIKEAWKSKEIISSFDNIKNMKMCKHLDLIGKEQNIYNIFATIIYSILITSFLGFVNGPLLTSDDWVTHLLFWLSLFFIGYLLMFAYSFKYINIVSSKLMMATGTLNIITSFNTGILNVFNPFINKLATFASIVTLYSIAFKHAKYDNKNKKTNLIK